MSWSWRVTIGVALCLSPTAVFAQPAVATASSFFDAIKQGQFQRAYAELSPQGRMQQSYADFSGSASRVQSTGASNAPRRMTYLGQVGSDFLVCFVEHPASNNGALLYLAAKVSTQNGQVDGYGVSSEPSQGCPS